MCNDSRLFVGVFILALLNVGSNYGALTSNAITNKYMSLMNYFLYIISLMRM